jgi:hypothetical protein
MAGASHEIEALLRTSDNASEANFPERRQRELGRITLPRTPLNKGKKKAGPPFLGGGMRWPARPHNGIVIQASNSENTLSTRLLNITLYALLIPKGNELLRTPFGRSSQNSFSPENEQIELACSGPRSPFPARLGEPLSRPIRNREVRASSRK